MKKAGNMSKKLIAILLSAAMTFTPMLQSMPVYATEVETQSEAENLGTMPEADELENAVSDDVSDDEEEAAGDDQAPNDEAVSDVTQGDDVSDDDSKGTDSDDGKEDNSGKVEENTEEKTETKTEAKEDTETKETVSEPVYEEVMEEESESASGSEEESESESEEMSQEEVRASYSITKSDVKAGGWNESIYAEISTVKDASAITKVSWTGAASGELSKTDLEYLVRIPKDSDGVRIDIPGLKAGTYTLSITVNGTASPVEISGISVQAYDRSGYAHFNYTDGVGAYKDDGTLKDNAIVIYVTDENKNTVELTDPRTGTKVKGIGNILNSVGASCGLAGHEEECRKYDSKKKKEYFAKANTNAGIIQKLAEGDYPLVVRFVGIVSDSGLYKQGAFDASSPSLIDGLTAYATKSSVSSNGNLADYGGTGGDNGHMARIKSGKNITLEGIGYDATIDGWGFHYMCESANAQYGKSFEVRNLTFINTPEDAVGMEGVQSDDKITASVERCWVHNNEFYCPNIVNPAESDKAQGDGSVDFKRGMYFTCSYNYYEGCHKTNLVGSADDSLQFNLTYHHNHWKSCEARGPLARQANIHMYNNLYEMQTSYAMNPRANAYIFSEYNMFYASKSPMEVKLGAVKSYHDSFASVIGSMDGTIVTDKSQKVTNNCKYLTTDLSSFDTDSTLSYIPGNHYLLDEDFTLLRKRIVSQTGTQERNPKLIEDMSPSDYTMLPSGTTVTSVTPPQTLTPGKIKGAYAFEVTGAIDVTVDADGVVLVSEAGEALLTGSGSVLELPAGIYWVQPMEFSPGKNGADPTYKNATVNSIKIEPHDPNAHYHKWVLDSAKSVGPTCTDAGKNVYTCTVDGCTEKTKEEAVEALGHDYTVSVATTKNPTCTEAGEGTFKCSRCDSTYSGTVPALGHDWGAWQVVTAATADSEGEEKRVCTRDSAHVETRTIPKGGTSGGNDDSSEGVVFHGDYVLTFENGRANGDTDFFTLENGTYENVTEKRTPTVNGTKYQGSFKLNNASASIKFTCDEDAILFLACSTDQTGKQIKLNDTKYPTKTDKNATLTIELSAGEYTITKESQPNICYLAVAYKTSVVYHTLSFVYNYSAEDEEDEPEPKTIQVAQGQTYSTMAALVPSSFTRSGYILKGLYEDAACTKPVTYPYTVNKDVDFYAQWEEDDTPVVESWTLYFNTDGGSGLVPAEVPKNQIYEIKQIPTKDGYVFTGWYDALTGGNLVSFIDGSTMTGNMTVYAHWNKENAQVSLLELICAEEFEKGMNITQKTTTKGGFIIHALPGGVGTAGEESPKYYMTVTDEGKLGTNGVLITDHPDDPMLKAIEFTTERKGTLTVKVELSGKGESGKTYNFVLAKQTSKSPLEYDEIDASHSFPAVTNAEMQTWTYALDEAGTYYVYPKGDKGVRYTSLEVTEPGYTIVYQTGTGTAPKGLTSVVKPAGAEIDIPGACTPAPGYIFKGWSVNGTDILTDKYIVDENDVEDGVITMMALYEVDEDNSISDKRGIQIEGLKEIKEGKYYEYTGDKITPDFDVVDYGTDGVRRLLTLGVDYTVTYKNNKDAGVATVTVKGKGNYASEKGNVAYKEFMIKKSEEIEENKIDDEKLISVKGAKVESIEKSFSYDGTPKYPGIKLTPKGSNEPYTYTYDEQNKKYVRDGDGDMNVYISVSNNVNKGNATIRVTGLTENNKLTEAKTKFKITAVKLDDTNTKISQKDKAEGISAVYSPQGAVPKSLVVKYNGNSLTYGKDYTLKYSGNKKAGTQGTVTVTGKGGYTGKATAKFDIDKAPMTDFKVAGATAHDGIKTVGKIKATVVHKNDGSELKAKQYQLVYYSKEDAANPIDPSVTLSELFAQNAENEPKELWVKAVAVDENLVADTETEKIKLTVGTDISKAKFEFVKGFSMSYTGNAVELNETDIKDDEGAAETKKVFERVTIKVDGQTKDLHIGTDYEIVSYTNNINKGTATAVIAGKGAYGGTKTIKFKIGQQKLILSLPEQVKTILNGLFN